MNNTEFNHIITRIEKIRLTLDKKLKKELASKFSDQYLTDFGPQILMSILASLCSSSVHDFVDICIKEEERDKVFKDIVNKLNDSILKAHNELRIKEMH